MLVHPIRFEFVNFAERVVRIREAVFLEFRRNAGMFEVSRA
jgi:hypothetical protein